MKYPYAIWRQFMVPQRLLTRFAGWVATRRWPWLKNYIIRSFCERYQVDMSEAANPDLTSYACFQDFFTRVLKVDARPIIHSSSVISSPCDGTISQIGKIDRGSIIQAKGHVFTVSHLLADDDSLAKQYDNGHFVTIYLAPRDYHRVHMPVKGTLSQTTYIPGKLFSVNNLTAEFIPELFSRNERLVANFNNSHPFSVILVGAMIVGSITTSWAGKISSKAKQVMRDDFTTPSRSQIKLDKGEEIGYFSLGSTVILLFPDNMEWEQNLSVGSTLKVGQKIGSFL